MASILPLGTEQNPQGLVHVLPRIMNVAVRWLQHSARLGHLALSQTVSKCSSSISCAVKWPASPLGRLFFSQRGRRSTGAGSSTIGKLALMAGSDSTGLAREHLSHQRMARIQMIALATEC